MSKHGTLVLVRHGESEWNKENRFTGWIDIPLTAKGMEDARCAGRELRRQHLEFDIAFTSHLVRAWKSLLLMLDELGEEGLPIVASRALNECNYGELAGIDKDAARRRWGEEQVRHWRRAFDDRPPGGESLRDVAERALPFLDARIMPLIREGRRVLIVSHSHTLRALIMRLERLTADQIAETEVHNGQIRVYRYHDTGRFSCSELTAAMQAS
jgi:2,3-bisphosphoglycerate-dependent phosphoglycerate mutase